jgi:hypothetical protein
MLTAIQTHYRALEALALNRDQPEPVTDLTGLIPGTIVPHLALSNSDLPFFPPFQQK